jgi:uncharacterized protein (UPF0332 family)
MADEVGFISVGKHLLRVGPNQSGLEDVFVRSSVNRFYYALFLRVRTVIAVVGNISEPRHSQVPHDLRVKVRERFREQAKRAVKHGIVSDAQATALRNRLFSFTEELANTMRWANTVRIDADYNLGVPVQDLETDPRLNGTPVRELQERYGSLRQKCLLILSDWSQIGG